MTKTKKLRWRKLDNAAKIFPATSSGRDTRVFRFYCELREDVDEETLKRAVHKALEKYPIFLMVLRKGLFWFYLEPSHLEPQICQEHEVPCGHLYVPDQKNLLFEVSYYKKRINFEVFHALTDGTGATQFLCEIVSDYLEITYGKLSEEHPRKETVPPVQEQETDSFTKYYDSTKNIKEKKPKAYQLRGHRLEYGAMQIQEYRLSVKEVLEKSRSYGVSMTVYLTAIFLCAIHKEMRLSDEKHPVVLMVPVNLRKYFPSDSMLNFFGWVEPGYQFAPDTTFDQVIDHVGSFFKEELLKEKVVQRMNAMTRLEKNPLLRAVPLELKTRFLQAGAHMSSGDLTAVFSNMSVIHMPREYSAYIQSFGVFTSTDKLELCMCSYGDELSLGFTFRKECEKILRDFEDLLQKDKITVRKVQNQFPDTIGEQKEKFKFFQWFSFLCIALAVVGIVANFIVNPSFFWSLFVTAGIGSLWLVTAFGFYKRRNLMKNAMWQLVIISVGTLLWDLATGWNDWALTYVWPITTLLALVFMLAIARIQRLSSEEYMIYYFMAAIFGLAPILFWALGWVTVGIPSLICGGTCVLVLAGLAVFRRKALSGELYKKFHV